MILSIMIGLIGIPISGSFSFKVVGLGYILGAPLFHYFIYEVRNYNEYYFYHNLGLSRVSLWILTFIKSAIIGLIFIVI